MKVVIGSTHLGEHFIEELRDTFPGVEFAAAYDSASQIEAIRDADVFFGWPEGRTFSSARKLKWIHCPGAGIDKITAYRVIVESDVPITNAPQHHAPSMADHVMGAMVGLAHRFQEAFEDRQAGRWNTAKYERRIIELTGRTVGLLGLGAIGRAIARRAAAFDMTVLAVDPGPVDVPDTVRECWGPDRLDDLVRLSDFIVVAAPLVPDTRNAIDRRRLKMMKPGSYVIVISRGGIVDEDALAEALQTGHLAGAALDATAVEPLPTASPFWKLDNVILTPHSSALTPELYEGRRETFRQNLRRFIDGEPLLNVCDKAGGY